MSILCMQCNVAWHMQAAVVTTLYKIMTVYYFYMAKSQFFMAKSHLIEVYKKSQNGHIRNVGVLQIESFAVALFLTSYCASYTHEHSKCPSTLQHDLPQL